MNAAILTDAQLATVLAGLRLLQEHGCFFTTAIEAIATDGGKHPRPTDAEIEALCERLNTSDCWDKIEAARDRLHYLLTDPDSADLTDDGDAAQDMVDAINAFTASATTTTEPTAMTITPAPALDHDAMMAKRFNHTVSANGHLERAIVWNLLNHLAAAGWNMEAIDDGDEEHEITSPKEAMELVFNLDEARLYLRKDQKRHWIFLVLGEGDTIITDHSYTEGDADGFNAAMDAFDAEAIAPALFTR